MKQVNFLGEAYNGFGPTQEPILRPQLVRQHRHPVCLGGEGQYSVTRQSLYASIKHYLQGSQLQKWNRRTVPSDYFNKLGCKLENLIPASVPQPVRVEDLSMIDEFIYPSRNKFSVLTQFLL
jgi:hypothetical protein